MKIHYPPFNHTVKAFNTVNITNTHLALHHHACLLISAHLPLPIGSHTRFVQPALRALTDPTVLTHRPSFHDCTYNTSNMPSTSHLRLQTSFEPFSAETTRTPFVSSPPAKKQKMSLTQTYYIAASARSKLGKEACRADHDLRLLVGHANLLDSLMIELQDAERQQEAWFHTTVAKAQKSEDRRIQWADSIVEEDDDDSSDDSSDSDYYDEDGDFDMVMPRRIAQPAVHISTTEVDDEDEEEDDQYDDLEDDEGLALTRVPSQSPPELVHDEDSDDESPPTPPQPTMEFSAKEAMLTTSFYDEKSQPLFSNDQLYLPESTAPLITSY